MSVLAAAIDWLERLRRLGIEELFDGDHLKILEALASGARLLAGELPIRIALPS